jgi:oligopeptide/dipeptide ABC transporter ATP-binding protein
VSGRTASGRPADAPLLTVEDLYVDFATQGGILEAVRSVSLTLEPGEILGIVGESGSGKSVTAHAIMRLLAANGSVSSGSVRYRGQDVASLDKGALRRFRGREVAMIFQEPGRSFDPIYSIGRSLTETLRAHNPDLTDEEARERSIRLLEEVHVSNAVERLDNFPHQFSGGLLQRIMIAHALAGEPAVLIADEPTTALDVTIQAGIIDLLLEIRERRNLAILFITHNLALISGFADRLLVMYGGLLMEEGPAERVLHTPQHPYTAGLMAGLIPFGAHYSADALRIMAGTPPDPLQPERGCPFAPRCPLAVDRCRAVVPPVLLVEDEQPGEAPGGDHAGSPGGAYRCIVTGPKSAVLFEKAPEKGDESVGEIGGVHP